MDGILPLYKPKGMTSHDCVIKIRKLLKIKKVGHTGTLDPGVEGVLTICLGEATKIIPFLKNSKTYIAEVTLGIATTTEDHEGEIVEKKEVTTPPTDEAIEATLKKFTGTIKQVPPMYSAVKVKGKRLYEYARENIAVDRPKRTVTIFDIKRLAQDDKNETNKRFRIEVKCSKGTYIRTLCVDIGKQLGYPAHMSYLLRTESDSITLDDTITFSEIEAKWKDDKLEEIVLPIERALEHLDVYQVSESVKKRVLNGQKLSARYVHVRTNPFKVMYGNQLLAIYERHKKNRHELKPVRVFHIHKD